MRSVCLLAVLLFGCTPAGEPPSPEPTLRLLDGYRDPADPCRRVGETPFTAEFLDHTADLAACPADGENLGVFVTETSASEVARTQSHVLYSVPHAPA